MLQPQNRHVDECNQIEGPNINLCNYSYLLFDKKMSKYILENRQHLQKMFLGKIDVHI